MRKRRGRWGRRGGKRNDGKDWKRREEDWEEGKRRRGKKGRRKEGDRTEEEKSIV